MIIFEIWKSAASVSIYPSGTKLAVRLLPEPSAKHIMLGRDPQQNSASAINIFFTAAKIKGFFK